MFTLHRNSPVMLRMVLLPMMFVAVSCFSQTQAKNPLSPLSTQIQQAFQSAYVHQSTADAGGSTVYLPLLANKAPALFASYRNGQTFLTWLEANDLQGEIYTLYRSKEAITAANYSSLPPIAVVGKNSATFFANRRDPGNGTWESRYLDRYVIENNGQQVAPGTGLLVWTPSLDDLGGAASGQGYYALTITPAQGSPVFQSGYSIGPVDEAVSDPQPVEITGSTPVSTGPGGHIYIQYMDLHNWNPTFHAPNASNHFYGLDPATPEFAHDLQYAYDYQLFTPTPDVCPKGKLPDKLPVVVHLHGWKDNNSVGVQSPYPLQDRYCAYGLYPVDEGNTWYFGFARDHDYRPDQTVAAGDTVVNFTEMRMLRMISDLEHNPPGPAVDVQRVYVSGQSMGGTGSLAYAERYPNVFAATYASQPMTDFLTAGTASSGQNWKDDGTVKWGSSSLNLPIALYAPNDWAKDLQKYNGTGAWDWENLMDGLSAAKLTDRIGDNMAPFGITHGSGDEIVRWETQGQPTYAALSNSGRAWGGSVNGDAHQWQYYLGLPPGLASLGSSIYSHVPFWGLAVVRDETIPGLSHLSGDSALPASNPAHYNQTILWSSSWYPWDGKPVDLPNIWQMSLCTTGLGWTKCSGSDETVSVTPRRVQNFVITPGAQYTWQSYTVDKNTPILNGKITADSHGLLTIPNLQITPVGIRLVIKPAG